MDDYFQLVFYHYILTDYELTKTIPQEFFSFGGGKLSICYELASEFFKTYMKAPTEQDLIDLIKIKGLDDKITEGFVHSVYVNKERYKESDPTWLRDNTLKWAKWKNLEAHVISGAQYIRKVGEEVTIENVDMHIDRARSVLNTGLVMDFGTVNNKGKSFWNALDHSQCTMARRTTGYEFLDMCLDGGYWDGCFIVFAGPPKIGKTQFLCNLAAKSFMSGYNTAYISLELPEEMILSRIGANVLDIPYMKYKKVTEDPDEMARILSNKRARSIRPPGMMYVKSFPTSTMTSMSLESALLEEEQRMSAELGTDFHFKNVFIDYLNIMSNHRAPNSENTYMKIKSLAEDTKAVGIQHDWAIITATQTNRESFNSRDINVNEIAESVGLNATVDAMFGIISDPIMKAQGEYWIKCLLDRVAPCDNKRKTFKFDKSYLRIIEDPDSDIVDVGDAVNGARLNYKKSERRTNIIRGGGDSVAAAAEVVSTTDTTPQMDTERPRTPSIPPNIHAIVDPETDEEGHDINPNVGRPMKLDPSMPYMPSASLFANRNGL